MNKTVYRLFAVLSVAAVAFTVRAVSETFSLKDGDNVVLIGDSITEQGFQYPWGYYHVLTNAAAEVAKTGGPKVNFIPLGYSGSQVKGWSEMERDSVTNASFRTWYSDPGWNLKEVFDGRVDVIVIFLGMNDLIRPSMRDTDADREKWLADYRTFVDNLRERCHPRRFVFATITPLMADPLSPKNIVRDKLNEMLAEYAADTPDAVCCELGDAVRHAIDAFKFRNHLILPVPDFVHPRRYGHRKLANCLARDGLGRLSADEPVCDDAECPERMLNCWLTLSRVNRPLDDEQIYTIQGVQHYRAAGESVKAPECPEVRLELPDGWTVDCQIRKSDGFFSFTVRGKPEYAVNPVTVVVSFRGRELDRETVNIPAPWRLSEDGGEWRVYTATDDYTGGMRPGSIDPYQCFFGWQTNVLRAARRVWSGKDRDVKAVLSHQGFSQTLDLSVALDGEVVWRDSLDRFGCDRRERTLHLKRGWNAVEVTCVHDAWQRQFSFDLEPLSGDELSDLRYDLK